MYFYFTHLDYFFCAFLFFCFTILSIDFFFHMYTRIDKKQQKNKTASCAIGWEGVFLKVGGADHDGALVGESLDGVLAVVAAHARVADSTEGERVVYLR